MIVAVALCAIIYIVFDFLQPRPTPEELAAAEEAKVQQLEDAAKPAEDGKVPGSDDAKAEAPAEDEDEPVEPTPDVEIVKHEIRNDMLALTISNRSPGSDGIIESIHLLDPQFEGHSTATDTFGLGGMRTLELSFADEKTEFRIPKRAAYEVRSTSDSSITLGYAGQGVEIEQTLQLLAGYEGLLTVKVTNRSGGAQDHRLHVRTRIAAGEGSRYDIRRGLCRNAEDVEDEDASDVEDGPVRYGPGIQWGGVDSKYFASLIVPAEPVTECEISASDDKGQVINHLGTAVSTLDDKQTTTYVFGLYIGPKSLERLQAFSAVDGVGAATLPEAIDWGILGGLSESLGKLLLGLLRWFYGLVGNWGISIVLLTVLVKLITLPLTLKQMASMKRMKEIQPEMAKIKEKYGDDRAKQTQEMQALFARSGVNPLAGCLPMVVQLPIWFALYSMLSAAVELVHVPFLWLPDLTLQDPVYVLPLALGGLMILQNRMMPTSSMGDETQAKMMRWIMPIMFTVFMLFLPSGLGIYIFANILLSIVQTAIQVGTNKKAEAATAAS
ncbi:MAG: membrane protein insertase YidC [Myxococcota bacterium]